MGLKKGNAVGVVHGISQFRRVLLEFFPLSSGDGIRIDDGVAVIITEGGKIIDFSVLAGDYIWDDECEPGCFTGKDNSLLDSFRALGGSFTYASSSDVDKYVIFVRTDVSVEYKFGTVSPKEYHDPIYQLSARLRYYGSYSYRVCDPILFSALAAESDNVEDLIRHEFDNAVSGALSLFEKSKISCIKLCGSKLLAKRIRETLSQTWSNQKGIELNALKINGISIDRGATDTIRLIGSSESNIAKNAIAGLRRASEQTDENTWLCECGNFASGKFCSECGAQRPDDIK